MVALEVDSRVRVQGFEFSIFPLGVRTSVSYISPLSFSFFT